jgi:heme-degrading monooxygenase HmoA
VIVELADIAVRPGQAAAFAGAFAEAKRELAGSVGFRSARLLSGIEQSDRVVLLIEWDRLEDHVEGFRGSPAFGRWRELIGPFFAAPPTVEHFEEAGTAP